MVLAYILWKDHLAARPVVCYIDNNSVSGSARNEIGSLLVKLFLTVESLSRSFAWFSRVPSPSNMADEPSKLLGPSFVDAAR